ncbi:hypothetical protein Tco_0382640 [Tanacetum coccineum]
MANVNVNAPAEQAPAMAPPTRTDDQILPRIRWVPVGKSNCYLDVEKSQSNPIYKIAVDILKHTNFFRAFTASLTIPLNLILQHKRSPTRPGSPSLFANEEHVLGYLKFSAKGTKREVFGMPIPNDLITADIRGEQYYNAYLEKVAKHKRYLSGEEVSDPDSPAPKPAKATKPKATKQYSLLESKHTNQSKKRKVVNKSSEAPSPAKQPKAGKIRNGLYGDEEADTQRAIEESLKEVHDAHRGPLPPVVIREPDSGKFQPLPDTPKKKSPAEQYIFQRRSSAPTEPSSYDESSSLYAEHGLTDSETESDEEVPGTDAGD